MCLICALAWSGEAWGDNHLPLTISSSNFKDIVSGNGVSWDNAPKRYQVWPPKQYYTNTGIRVNDGKTATLTFTGIPDKLSFTYEKQEAATGIGWAVKEYTNGAWKQIWTSSDGEGSANIQLSPDVRKVQLCWNGNTLTGVFSDVTISELHYFSVEPTSLDFGSTNYLYDGSLQKTFKVKHCNAGSNVTLTSNDANYTVSPSTLTTTGSDKMGEETITVTYLNTNVGSHNSGKITVKDPNNTKYTNSDQNVSLKGTTLDRYMTVDKTSLSFGTNYKGDEVATQTFTISHCNLASGIAVSSSNTTDFTVSSSSVTTELGTTSTASITVTYTNNTVGDNSGTITIHDKSGKIADKTISLSGKTLDRYMTVDKTSLSFGTNYKGDEVATQTFTISHCNLASGIAVSSSNTTDFTVSSSSVTTELGTTSTASITVTYTNNTVGDNSGTITIHDKSGKIADKTISLSGKTLDRYMTVDKTSLSFGTNYKGDEVATQTFTISHCNLASGIAVSSSNTTDFTVSSSSVTTELGTTSTASITVTYTNNTVGDNSGTITIHDKSGKIADKTISLSGKTLDRYMTVDKTSLSFGTNYKGDEVATQTFTISHCNLASGIAVSSSNTTDFTVSSSSVTTELGTTSTASITVTYTNNTVGDNSGTITIHDNSGKTDDLTVSVSGTTRNRYLRTATESVNFGIVDEDATAPDKTFDITHLNLSANITVSYSGDNVFSVTPTSITTATDNNEKTSTITAHFDNTIPGDYSGTITVTDNSGKCSALVITVTGSSKSLSIVLDPLSPDYEDSYYKNITLSRTLKAGYSTIALPFNTTVGAIVGKNYDSSVDWVAQLSAVTNSVADGYTLYFQKVENGVIEANQPYVLHLGTQVVNPTWTDLENGIGVEEAEATSVQPATGYSGYAGWKMWSNFTPNFPMDGKYGIVNNSQLTGTDKTTYLDGGLMLGSGSSAKLNAFTAYITAPQANPAPRLRVAYVDTDGTTTFIGSLPEEDLQGEPVAIYGPDGQRRSKMQRGVNIVRFADGTTRKVQY